MELERIIITLFVKLLDVELMHELRLWHSIKYVALRSYCLKMNVIAWAG